MDSVVDKALGLAVAFVVLCMASGHPKWIWKGIAYARYTALKEARQPWGCPSFFRGRTPASTTIRLDIVNSLLCLA